MVRVRTPGQLGRGKDPPRAGRYLPCGRCCGEGEAGVACEGDHLCGGGGGCPLWKVVVGGEGSPLLRLAGVGGAAPVRLAGVAPVGFVVGEDAGYPRLVI